MSPRFRVIFCSTFLQAAKGVLQILFNLINSLCMVDNVNILVFQEEPIKRG